MELRKKGEKNVKEQNSQDGEKTKKESKERDILIERAIMGLARNLALKKFSGIHENDTPAKTLNNNRVDSHTDLALSSN